MREFLTLFVFLRFTPAQDLIRRERQNPKHKMRHRFGPSAHPHKPPSEFIFQPREDAFHCGALAKTDPLMGICPSATSTCNLKPIQKDLLPLLLVLQPTSQARGKSANIWPNVIVPEHCRSSLVI